MEFNQKMFLFFSLIILPQIFRELVEHDICYGIRSLKLYSKGFFDFLSRQKISGESIKGQSVPSILPNNM